MTKFIATLIFVLSVVIPILTPFPANSAYLFDIHGVGTPPEGNSCSDFGSGWDYSSSRGVIDMYIQFYNFQAVTMDFEYPDPDIIAYPEDGDDITFLLENRTSQPWVGMEVILSGSAYLPSSLYPNTNWETNYLDVDGVWHTGEEMEWPLVGWPPEDITSFTIVFDPDADNTGYGIEILGYVDHDGSPFSISLQPISAVPIPSALWLFATGLIGLISIKRKETKE